MDMNGRSLFYRNTAIGSMKYTILLKPVIKADIIWLIGTMMIFMESDAAPVGKKNISVMIMSEI